MKIHAYDEIYVESAQRVLGDMFDYAVNSYGYSIEKFFDFFVNSPLVKQVEKGNPRYIAGMNGCELFRSVIEYYHFEIMDKEDVMNTDKSIVYWCGYALATYQWYSNRSFKEIVEAIPLDQLRMLYLPLHEADTEKMIEVMERRVSNYYQKTNLRRQRIKMGYSQGQLALKSGVPLRQIQLLEQKQRDINKLASYQLYALSKALLCSMEELIEK